MQNIQHVVKRKDNVLDVCRYYNISLDQLIDNNCVSYPKLLENPFMIYQGWILSIPLIGNGGDTQYKMGNE